MINKILITGGTGFIGSNLTRPAHGLGHQVLIIDKLTYAGNRPSLADLKGQPGSAFLQADIFCRGDARGLGDLLPERGHAPSCRISRRLLD
jgi:dTDP-glucose 4,6-dehydratase